MHPSNKDYLLARNVKDSGDPYKDKLKSWAMDKFVQNLKAYFMADHLTGVCTMLTDFFGWNRCEMPFSGLQGKCRTRKLNLTRKHLVTSGESLLKGPIMP